MASVVIVLNLLIPVCCALQRRHDEISVVMVIIVHGCMGVGLGFCPMDANYMICSSAFFLSLQNRLNDGFFDS